MAFNPKPGPQQPGKYPQTGPHYAQYGELPGFNYIPALDKYVPSQETKDQIAGKPPAQGLSQTLLPIAATAGALYGTQALAPQLIGSAKDGTGILGSLGGLFGDSKAVAPVAEIPGATALNSATALGPGVINDAAGNAVASAVPEGFYTGGSGGGLFSIGGIGSAGNAILPAAGALGAFDVLSNNYGAGRGALEGAASGAAIGSYFGPAGAGIGAGIGGLIGLGKSLFHHETTKQAEKKNWSNIEANASDPATKAYAAQYQQYLDSPQAKADAQNSPFKKGDYASLTPEQVWGGAGMFKTFGSDWLNKYNENQRRQISQGLIGAGLIGSKKGDIIITDPTKAKEIANQITGQGKGA